MDSRQHRYHSQQSSLFHTGQGSGSNGGRRTFRDTGVPSLPYWQNKTPALLKADDAESFIASKRSERFKRNSTAGSVSGRARSEIGELIGSGPPRFGYNYRHDISYHEDLSRAATRSVSYYDRPRSSFEHSSREPVAPLPVLSRVARPRQGDWIEVERRSGVTGPSQGPYHSSEDEYSDVDDDDEAEMSAAYGSRNSRDYRPRYVFTPEDYNAFGTVRLSATRARQIIRSDPPPSEFWDLSPHEKTTYLFYHVLYRHYMKQTIKKFKIIFNKEFYKYQSQGMNENAALVEICAKTKQEYDAKRVIINKQAYDRTQRHLFSDDRATPDSRASDRPSFCDQRQDESDIASIDSVAKEPLKFTRPHSIISFGIGGRLLVLNPEKSISTIRIEDVKSHIRNRKDLQNIDAIEEFKGPLIVGTTSKHVPMLFVENQIKRIMMSEIYRQNPANCDANDVLLIWNLLKTLIITGPELARLLTGNYTYTTVPSRPVRDRSDKDYMTTLNAEVSTSCRSDSPYIDSFNDQRRVDPKAMDTYTQFLFNGYVDEAIDCAIKHGMLFDAIILAYRIFKHDRLKLDQIESKMLACRDPQHPTLTLLSVASNMPVPILANMSSTDDASSWRAHIAIVLANLDTPTALKTVHHLGLALARRDFHSAADFCFLAVNLLKKHEYEQYDCFVPVEKESVEGPEKVLRQHITLINASLPDDDYYSTQTRYGWSITDLQATEIYDYARRLTPDQAVAPVFLEGPSNQIEYQRCRLEYAKMLAECGGAESTAYKYCTSIASTLWNIMDRFPASFLNELCDLADRLQYVAAATTDEFQWIPILRGLIANGVGTHEAPNEISEIPKPEAVDVTAQAFQSADSIALGMSIDPELNVTQTGVPGFATSTPVPSVLPSDIVSAPVPQQVHQAVSLPVPQDVYQKQAQQYHWQDQQAYSVNATQNYDPQTVNSEHASSTTVTDQLRHATASPALSTISNATIAAYENADNAVRTVACQPSINIDAIQIDSHQEPISIATTPPPNHQAQQVQQAKQQQYQVPAVCVPSTNVSTRERSWSQSSSGTPLGSPSYASNYTPSGPANFEYSSPPSTQSQQPSREQHAPGPLSALKPAPAPEPVYQQRLPQPPASAPVAPDQQAPLPVQQQQSAPVQQQQSTPVQQQASNKQQQSKGGGFFSGFKNKLVQMIPNGANEMKLPDDGKPSIWWDEKQQRWVGEGVEEPAAPPPPPPSAFQTSEVITPGVPLAASPPVMGRAPLKRGATSRYANAFASSVATSTSTPSFSPEGLGLPSMGAAFPPLPPTFGFIPAPMPDNDNCEAVDPFSSGVQSTDQAAQ